MLPTFRNVAVLAKSVFLMRICFPNRRQDLLKHEPCCRQRLERSSSLAKGLTLMTA